MEYDQVIVGGGISGLYTCYKLNDHRNTALFESTYRLGGRLQTDRYQSFIMDYGPTRFQIRNDDNLVKLLKELHIPFVETEKYKSIHVKPYLSQLTYNEKIVYQDAEQKGESPVFSLIEFALKEILGNQWDFETNHIFNETRTLNMTYLKCCATYREKPLWTYGTWDLLCVVLSPEALTYIKANSSFYHMIEYNLNAQTHICYLLDILAARGESKLYTIENGMGVLTTRLETEVAQHTKIYTGHTLVSIGNSCLGKKLKLTFICDNGNKVIVITSRLFLCMHQAGIDKILGLPTTIKNFVNCVQPIRLFKLFAIIEDPPSKGDDTNMEFINNAYIPCREIHYRYNPKNNLGELLLYGDFPSINYWRYYSVNQKNQIVPENNQNTELKKQINSVLRRIFPENENINIIHYGIRDWSLPPFHSGVHFWKPDVNPFIICKYLRYFMMGEAKVSICGEAFNFRQGYVESALESVEEALACDKNPWLNRTTPFPLLHTHVNGINSMNYNNMSNTNNTNNTNNNVCLWCFRPHKTT